MIESVAYRTIPCEVIGFSGNNAVVMPFAGLDGVRRYLTVAEECARTGRARLAS